MVNLFENFDLSCHSSLIWHLGNLCLLKDLYCYSLLSVDVLTKLNFTKGSFTQIFTDLVVSYLFESSAFFFGDWFVIFPFLHNPLDRLLLLRYFYCNITFPSRLKVVFLACSWGVAYCLGALIHLDWCCWAGIVIGSLKWDSNLAICWNCINTLRFTTLFLDSNGWVNYLIQVCLSRINFFIWFCCRYSRWNIRD